MEVLINSALPTLHASGLDLDWCFESDLETVEGLSVQQKNALKMVIRKGAQTRKAAFPSPIDDLIASTVDPIREAFLDPDWIEEGDLKSVEGLRIEQKNALRMAIRKREHLKGILNHDQTCAHRSYSIL